MEDGELISYGLLKYREEVKANDKLSGEEKQQLLAEIDSEVDEYRDLMEEEAERREQEKQEAKEKEAEQKQAKKEAEQEQAVKDQPKQQDIRSIRTTRATKSTAGTRTAVKCRCVKVHRLIKRLMTKGGVSIVQLWLFYEAILPETIHNEYDFKSIVIGSELEHDVTIQTFPFTQGPLQLEKAEEGFSS